MTAKKVKKKPDVAFKCIEEQEAFTPIPINVGRKEIFRAKGSADRWSIMSRSLKPGILQGIAMIMVQRTQKRLWAKANKFYPMTLNNDWRIEEGPGGRMVLQRTA